MSADDAPRIRDFQPGDEDAFRRLNEEWIARYFVLEDKDRRLFADPRGLILDRGGRIFIAEIAGEPVGCVALLALDPETFEVAKMAVAPAHQGKGLGRLLLERCIEHARSVGKKRLYLETNSKLAPAVALYRKLGFVEVHADRRPQSSYARVDLVMEFWLS